MDEPTYIATASKGDVVIVSLPTGMSHDAIDAMRSGLAPYLRERGIGLVIVGDGAKAEVRTENGQG